jgi:hypothetical protein
MNNTTHPTTFAEEITRTSDRARAERFKAAVHGRTYMDFRVLVCPAGGEFSIVVESSYPAPAEEVRGMLLHLMAAEIMRG